jgi:hypothetical protein
MPGITEDQVNELRAMVKKLKKMLHDINPKLMLIKSFKKFEMLGAEGYFLPFQVTKLHKAVNDYIELCGDEEELMMLYAEMYPSTSDD